MKKFYLTEVYGQSCVVGKCHDKQPMVDYCRLSKTSEPSFSIHTNSTFYNSQRLNKKVMITATPLVRFIQRAVLAMMVFTGLAMGSFAQAPVITGQTVSGADCNAAVSHLVSANVVPGSGSLTSVVLNYYNGSAGSVSMTGSGSVYSATIPAASPANAPVSWSITAINSLGGTSTIQGDSYIDAPYLSVNAFSSASTNPVCSGSPVQLTATINKIPFQELFESTFPITTFSVSSLSGAATLTQNSLSSQASFSGLFHAGSDNDRDTMTMVSSINLTGNSSATLTFSHIAALEGSFTAFDFGFVEYSTNGGQTWTSFKSTDYVGGASTALFNGTTVRFSDLSYSNWASALTGSGSVPDNSLWQKETFNIPAAALTSTNFKIRFRMTTDVSIIYYGWLLDDIKISMVPNISSHVWSDGIYANNTTGNPTTRNPVAVTNYVDSVTDINGCVLAVPDITVAIYALPTAPVDSTLSSTQCGTPTFIVKKVNGATYKWYSNSSGGPLLFSSSTTSTFQYTGYPGAGVVTVYATVTNSNGCESARTPISVTVTAPPVLTVSPSGTYSTCVNSIIPITVTSTLGNYTTYNWTPTNSTVWTNSSATTLYTGVGNPTSLWYKRTTTGTETVSLVATNGGGCSGSVNIVFTTSPAAVFNGGTATPNTICAGNQVTLKADSSVAGTVSLGTCNTSYSGTSGNPFSLFFEAAHNQYLYKASDLTAAGLLAGDITKLFLNVSTKNSGSVAFPSFLGYTIRMANTSLTDLSGGVTGTPTFTTVYGPTAYTTSAGSNAFPFTTNFTWDGVSNVIVDICFSNDDVNNTNGTAWSANDVVCASTTSYVGTAGIFSDNNNYCGLTSGSNASTASKVPDITFNGPTKSSSGSLNYVWNPGSLSGYTVTVFPVTPPTSTYTVTASIPGATGTTCSATSANINIAVSPNSLITPTVAGTTTNQCGTPIYNVTSSGVASPIYTWYTCPGACAPLDSGATYHYNGYTPGAPNVLYVTVKSGHTGCESAKVKDSVFATTPPTLTISPSGSQQICACTIVPISVTSTLANFNSYVWSPNTHLYSDAGATIAYTGTSLTTVYYKNCTPSSTPEVITLTAFNSSSQCTNIITLSITVGAVPSITSVTATPNPICVGGAVSLTAKSSTAVPSTGTPGGAATTTEFGGSVFRTGISGDTHTQLLFSAAEMTAAGFAAGNLTCLSFNVSSLGAGSLDNYTISLANTTTSSLTNTFAPDLLTQVYTISNYTPVSGTNSFSFGTGTGSAASFAWDGTSNILINICYTNNNAIGSSTVSATVPPFTGNNQQLGTSGACSSSSAPNTYVNRPSVTFCGQIGTDVTSSYTWTWASSGTATASAAAAGATSTSNALTSGSLIYTATATLGTCSASLAASAITVNAATGTPPTNGSTSPQCATSNSPDALVFVANATVGYTIFKWYKNPTGGSPIRTASAGLTTDTFRYTAYHRSGCDTLYVSVSSVGGCETPRTQIIVCDQTPVLTTLPANGSTTATCLNVYQAIKVVSNVADYATYSWASNTDLFQNTSATAYTGQNLSQIYYKGSTLTSNAQCYTLTATTSGGCVSTSSFCFTVNSAPTGVTAGVSTTGPVCANTGSILLSGNANTVYTTTILTEDFNSNAPTWIINNNSGTGQAASNFAFQTSGTFTGAFGGTYLVIAKNGSNVTVPYTTGNGGNFLLANYAATSSGDSHVTNTVITSPSFSTSSFTPASLTLTFEHFYKRGATDDTVAVEISTNGGSTWSTLKDCKAAVAVGASIGSQAFSQPLSPSGTFSESISLSSYIGTNVKIRFKYKSTGGYCWIIDNVKITGQQTIPNTFTWVATPGSCATIANPNSQNSLAVLSCSASFKVTATNTSGCSTTSSATPTVAVSTLDVTASLTDATCFGSSTGTITPTATGGTGSYQYALGSIGGTYFAAPHTFTNLPAGLYKVFVKDTKPCYDSVTVIVGQPTAIAATPTPNDPTCNNFNDGSIEVTAVGGTPDGSGFYTFSISGGSPATSQSPQLTDDAVFTGLYSGAYTIVVTDANGCTDTLHVTLNNPAKPGVTAVASPNPACNGSNVTFTATTGSPNLFQWSGVNGFAPAPGAVVVRNGVNVATDAGVYTVTIVDGNGCPDTASTTLSINPTITASVSLSVAPGLNICPGTSVTFTATPTNGGATPTYQFFVNGSSVQNSSSNTYTFTPADLDKVYVIMSPTIDPTNCAAGPATSVTDTVHYATLTPAVTMTASVNPVCAGTSVTYTAVSGGTGGTNPTYVFYVNHTAHATGTTNTYSYVPAANDSIWVIMTKDPTATCVANTPATSDTVVMTINALPPTPTIQGTRAQCGTSLSDTATSAFGTIFKWYTTLTAGPAPITNAGILNYTGTLGLSSIYYVTVTNSNGCESSPRIKDSVLASNSPTVSINGAATFCSNDSTLLTLTVTPGNGSIINYVWKRGVVTVSSGPAASTYMALLPGNYKCTVTNSNGCSTTSAVFTLSSNTAPTNSIAATCTSVFSGQTSTFTSTAVAGSGSISTYQWYLNGSTPVGTNSATYTTSVAGSYTCVVTNTLGCHTTSNAITLSVNSSPLCGAYTIGGSGCTNFSSIASAVSYLNSYGVSCAVTFNVANSYTEVAPNGGFVIGGAGSAILTGAAASSSTNTISFIAGTNDTIKASNTQTSGSLSDAIIKLVGADWVTINGFNLVENSSNATTTPASNNMTEFGVGLFYVSATDGAHNNTISNNKISLNKAYANTWGVYSNTRHTYTAPTVTADITNATGANDSNKVYSNTISNVNFGIAFIGSGSATAGLQDIGNCIGGSNSTLGNTITTWGGLPQASVYVSNAAATSYCIYLNHQTVDTVAYNTITSSSVSGTAVVFNGIMKDYTTAPTGTFTSNITNNTITMTDGFTSLAFNHIITNGGIAGMTLNINSNTLLNSSVTGASSSTRMVGISNSGAVGTLNMNNNIIKGLSSTATTGGFLGLWNSGAVVNAININSNKIDSNTLASTAGVKFTVATTADSVMFVKNSGGAATCALTIQSNDIKGVVHNLAGASVHNYFINFAATASQNISSNTFTNLNVNTSGNLTFIANDVSLTSTGSATINSNAIVGTFTKASAGGTVTLYNASAATSASGATKSEQLNNFSNITLTGATTMAGWVDNEGTAAGGGATKTIYGNTFNSWNTGSGTLTALAVNKSGNLSVVRKNTFNALTSTSTITVINFGSGNVGTTMSIDSNTISNLTGSAAITGLTTGNNGPSSVTNLNINSNNLNTFTTSGATAVVGLAIGTAPTSGTPNFNVNIYKNKIYDLTANNAGAQIVTGLLFQNLAFGTSTIQATVYNNLIGNMLNPIGTGTDIVRGISFTNSLGSASVTANYKIYFNTVYLSGTSSSVTFGGSGIFFTTLAAANNGVLDMRNNLIVNNITPKGTGLAVAYRRSVGTAGTLANYSANSNNNLFYAGTPGASNLIYSDGTSSAQTITAYKNGVFTAGTIAPRDAVDTTENPSFISTAGANAGFLHITAGVTTNLESAGQTIAGITDDYDGDTRTATYTGCSSGPDIGADEFAGVAPTETWIGNTSDWSSASNWCGGVVPTGTMNVIIPTAPGGGNFPKVPAGSFSVQNITLQSNSSISVAPGATFTIKGVYSATAATLTDSGKIVLNAGVAQSFPGTTTTVNYVNDIEINNTAGGVNIDKSMTIWGKFTPTAGVVNIKANVYVTLKSTATSTAQIGKVGAGASITYAGLTSRFVIERYYPAHRAWHLTTAPVTTDPLITMYSSWQNKGGANVPGNYTWITSQNPAVGSGMDNSPQNNYSLKKYNTATQTFINMDSTINVNISGTAGVAGTPDNVGYFMFVRGDRDPLNLDPTHWNFTTLRDTGRIQYGTETFTCNSGANKYTFIGNPYASPVDFDAITFNNIPKKFWAWDPNLNVVGGYVIVDGQAGPYVTVPTVGTNINRYLQSSQAFFVNNYNGGAASLVFNEAAKNDSNNLNVFRQTNMPVPSLVTNLYQLNPDGTTKYSDGNLAQFDSSFSIGVDVLDGVKFGNVNEQLSYVRDSKSLALERRPMVNCNDTMFLKLTKTVQRKYRFEIIASNLNKPGLMGYLEDSYLSTSTPLDLNGSINVDFDITGDAASSNPSRFQIVFKPATALPISLRSIRAWRQNADNMVEWKVENELNMHHYEVEKSTDGAHFTFANQTIASGNTGVGTVTYNWLDTRPVSGDNYYRVRSIGQNGSVNISPIVKVAVGKLVPSIVIYPNPVVNGIISLQMNNLEKGNYIAKLFNQAGQLIQISTIQHPGGNASASIQPDHLLASGMYQLEITAPDKVASVYQVEVK